MKTWKSVLTLSGYLIQGITDVGMMETYEDDGTPIDKDDLRIAIELSGGQVVVVPGAARLVPDDNGDLTIEVLVETND